MAPSAGRVAELALAFGMTVLVSDPYVTVEHGGIEQVELDELLEALRLRPAAGGGDRGDREPDRRGHSCG